MAKAKTDELVKKETTALAHGAHDLPDYLQEFKGSHEGREDMEREDIILPRLAICQAMSEERSKSSPKFIEGLEEGDIFNTLTQQIYGREIEIIPLAMYKTAIRFTPMEEGGGIECMSPDAKTCQKYGTCQCGSGFWSEDNKGNRVPPPCTKIVNYLAYCPSTDEVAILGMKITSMDTARRFNSLMNAKSAPTWAGKYLISTLEDMNDQKQRYFIYAVRNNGWTPPDLVSKVRGMHDEFTEYIKAGRIQEANAKEMANAESSEAEATSKSNEDVPF